MANQLIQKLLDAEQEADAIIRRARENWAKKHKEAELSAEEEIQRFKAQEEDKFQKEYIQKYGKRDQNDGLDEQTKSDIEQIKAQYKSHRDAAVALLISGVVKVDLNLSNREEHQIKLLFEEKELLKK